MSGVLNLLLAGAASAITDAYYNLTTLLLNTSSTNGAQNNTFLDSSTNNFSITRNGNTTQGTFTPFSQTGWSNYFGGSDYLSIPSATALQLTAASAFTIEAWINPNSSLVSAGAKGIVGKRNTGTEWQFFAASDGTLSVYNGSTSYSGGTAVTAVGQWVHVAVTWDTTTLRFFINGTQCATTFTSFSLGTASTNAVTIASDSPGAELFPGYISNLRITKGGALYTSSFTPSTTPLTTTVSAGTVSLLTCQSNRFVDNSANGFTVSVGGGTPSVQAFSPFAPTIEYDTAVVGGSGYFDGTGDYLTVGSGTDVDLGTSDFMIEAWYYCLANGTYASGVISKRVGGAASGWGMTTSGFVCDMAGTWYDSWALPFWVGSTQNSGFNSGTSLQKLNQWTHIVVTRQGTDARWFVNGQLLGYFSRTGAIQQLTGSPLAVGLNGTTAEQPFNGYISNCRVVVGSVPTGYQTSSTTLNTQIFTPPTAPVSTTSQGATSGNVKYIGNFTNAGIYDSTAKNVLETVGNAQVSTTQAKWGTTSMYFDGTGDCLQFPATQNFLFGGDFTIEGWFNRDNGADNSIFVINTSGANYFAINVNSAGYNIYLNGSSPAFSPSVTLSNNTWYYFSLVRSGSTVTLYHNGSSVGTTTNSSVLGSSSAVAYVGGIGGGLKAYVDDLRITKYARTITASPTAAFFLQ